jgi:CYTH domain-containing protein
MLTAGEGRYLMPTESGEVEVDVSWPSWRECSLLRWSSTPRPRSDAFEPPDWLGIVVTDDERYANEKIVTRGLPEEGEC